MEYAVKVVKELKDSGIRVELYNSNDTLGKKIRTAELQKIPYMLVVGEKEMTDSTVTARDYATKKQETMKVDAFVKMVSGLNKVL